MTKKATHKSSQYTLIPFRLDENKRTAIVRLLVPFFIESLSARKKAPPEDHREQVKELSTWSILSISISRGATCSHCTGNSDLREIKKPQIVDGILSLSVKLTIRPYGTHGTDVIMCVIVGRMHSDAKGWSISFIEKIRCLYCVREPFIY
jgi:hypothetical protein